MLERGQAANACEKRSYRLSCSEAPQPGAASRPCCEVTTRDHGTGRQGGRWDDGGAWGHLSRQQHPQLASPAPPSTHLAGRSGCSGRQVDSPQEVPLEGQRQIRGLAPPRGWLPQAVASRGGISHCQQQPGERPVFRSEPGRGRAEDISGQTDPPRNPAPPPCTPPPALAPDLPGPSPTEQPCRSLRSPTRGTRPLGLLGGPRPPDTDPAPAAAHGPPVGRGPPFRESLADVNPQGKGGQK